MVDAPTALPDGTVVNLVLDDEDDDLAEDERTALEHHLEVSREQMLRGQVRPAVDVLDELRRRKP